MLLHTDLFVESIERSLDFYVNGLGLEVLDDFEVFGDLVRFVSNGRYEKYRVVLLQIRFGSAMLELIMYLGKENRSAGEARKSQSTVAIFVPSIEEKINELRHKGIFPCSEVYCVHTKRFGKSRIVFFEDPDGNSIEFLEKYEQ